MITVAGPLAKAVEDEVEQAGGAAVLLKYLVNPVKELSGELRRVNNLYSCSSAGVPAGEACYRQPTNPTTIRLARWVENDEQKMERSDGAKDKAGLCFGDNFSIWRCAVKPERELYSRLT